MNTRLQHKSVALVGGAGFVGHHLALRLAGLGARPQVIDSLEVNNLGAFPADRAHGGSGLYRQMILDRLDLLQAAGIPFHLVDARDGAALRRTLEAIEPDCIVHLAGVAHANRADNDPAHACDHIARTLENSLEAARTLGSHLISFSSSMVYGHFGGDAVTEDRRCAPLGIYGAVKYGGEKLVTAYGQVFGLSYTIIRPSALYGERCVSRRVGQAFIESALRRQPLVVKGDGSEALDFTHINDLVRGAVLCITHPGARNQVFNLTFGDARSLRQMIDLMQTEFPDLEVEFQPRDERLPLRGTLDIGKARRLLDYDPACPLETAFPEYIRWYKDLAVRRPDFFAHAMKPETAGR